MYCMCFNSPGVYIHSVAPSLHFTYTTACCRDNCGHGEALNRREKRWREETRGRLRGEREEQEIEKIAARAGEWSSEGRGV